MYNYSLDGRSPLQRPRLSGPLAGRDVLIDFCAIERRGEKEKYRAAARSRRETEQCVVERE